MRALIAALTQAEQRERKRLSQILHDHLQQILVGARMRLEALRAGPVSPEQIDALVRADQLLDQCIGESRSLAMQLCPPILHDAGLRAALEWLAREHREKHGLTVALTLDVDEGAVEEATQIVLFHGIRELLFNVLKHAGIHRVEVQSRKAPEGYLGIKVRDEGVGFDTSLLDSGQQGGGIGLYTLRERLEMIGGSMALESAPGKGTRFVLRAPCGVAATPPGSADKIEEMQEASAPFRDRMPAGGIGSLALAAPSMPRIRELIVDDHPIMREALTATLKDWAEVEVVGEACDGLEAVESAGILRPDVILMDVSMPRLNGIEATRRLKEEWPEMCVIGLSMHEGEDMGSAMRQAGALAYLSKSQPTGELGKILRKLISEHRKNDRGTMLGRSR